MDRKNGCDASTEESIISLSSISSFLPAGKGDASYLSVISGRDWVLYEGGSKEKTGHALRSKHCWSRVTDAQKNGRGCTQDVCV